MVVFKRLSEALADGDPVWGVIRGSGAQSGTVAAMGHRTHGPSQEIAIRAALADSGGGGSQSVMWKPMAPVPHWETRLRLRRLRTCMVQEERKPSVGRIGPQVTSGTWSRLRVWPGSLRQCWRLHHQQVPGNLHFGTPNRLIAWPEMHWQVPVEPQPLRSATASRCVPEFPVRVWGTNAHVVVQDAKSGKITQRGKRSESAPVSRMLVLSARDRTALRALVDAHLAMIQAHPKLDLTKYAVPVRDRQRLIFPVVGHYPSGLVQSWCSV